MKKRLKAAALLLTAAVTAAIPFAMGSGGAAFAPPVGITAHADGAYDKLAIELAGATAFDDARNAIKSAEDPEAAQQQFQENLGLLTSGMHFGNVGIFVGPKGTSKNSDVWSVYQSKVTINNEQIQAYDTFTENAFTKYKVFGGAVQKLNAKAQKAKGSSTSVEKGLDELSAAGAKLTSLGTELLSDYNPAPVVLSLFDCNNLNTHPDNKLVALVNANEHLRGIVQFFGSAAFGNIPLSFIILAFGIVVLVLTSVLMTLLNGRSAGENIRKAMVKLVIGCLAVPLLAKGLDAGVEFLNSISVKQAASPESNYVEENLNFADWYACGFGVPSGTSIAINKNGEFVFSPEAVRAINTYTYKVVWGVDDPTDAQMKDKMEEYYNMYKGSPMGVGFSEPVKNGTTKNWNTKNFYATLANFGENKVLNEGIELKDGVDRPDLGNVGYYITNATNMEQKGKGWAIHGCDTEHGISPIAATNMMRTSFTGSAMVVNSNSVMGSVVFDADNGVGVADSKMNPITRFIATFAMVMAAMKGLFTIFAAGFGGIFGGGAKAMTGSSQGIGQAIGGGVALIGGVFGISIIMTLSFTLLDQLYAVMQSLLSGTTAGNDILEPFKEVVEDIPLIGGLLGDALKNVARFILTIMCALTLPKFGGIPVTLFCQGLSELPGRFAERAQSIENKFTGDFRGGAGGHSSMMNNATQLVQQASADGKQQMQGVKQGLGTIGGALGGYAMTKAGQKLEARHGAGNAGNAPDGKGSMSGRPENAPGAEDASMARSDAEMEAAEAAAAAAGAADGPQDAARGDEAKDTAPEAAPQDAARGDEAKEAGGAEAAPAADGSVSNMETTEEGATNVDGNDMQSLEKDTESYAEGAENTETMDSEQSMSQDSDTVQTEASMSETASTEQNVSSDSSMSEASAETEALSESLSMDEHAEGAQSMVSESSAMATVNSEASSAVDSHSESVQTPDKSGTQAAGKAPSGEAMKTSAQAQAAQNAPSAAGRSMAPGNRAGANAQGRASQAANVPSARFEARQQKRDRHMMAIAKGLQAAGGHTTGAQAAAGVLAGAAHVAGSAAGAQNVTAKGVNAVQSYRQRQNDIRAGLPAGYTARQQAQNAQAGQRPAAESRKPVQQNADAARQSAVFAEALAREAEAYDAQREAARRNAADADAARRRRTVSQTGGSAEQ